MKVVTNNATDIYIYTCTCKFSVYVCPWSICNNMPWVMYSLNQYLNCMFFRRIIHVCKRYLLIQLVRSFVIFFPSEKNYFLQIFFELQVWVWTCKELSSLVNKITNYSVEIGKSTEKWIHKTTTKFTWTMFIRALFCPSCPPCGRAKLCVMPW